MFRMINIEKKKRRDVLENKIDVTNYLGMKQNRLSLVEYGIAVGYDDPKPIEKKDALFRDSYIENNSQLQALLVSLAVGKMGSNADLNKVLTADGIGEIVDQCLNGGLIIIEDEIDNQAINYDRKIFELDELYEEIFGK